MKIKIEIHEVMEWDEEDTSYEKVAETGNERDNGPIFKYVSTGKTSKRRDTKLIYKQEVKVESLTHIIAAINNLEEKK